MAQIRKGACWCGADALYDGIRADESEVQAVAKREHRSLMEVRRTLSFKCVACGKPCGHCRCGDLESWKQRVRTDNKFMEPWFNVGDHRFVKD